MVRPRTRADHIGSWLWRRCSSQSSSISFTCHVNHERPRGAFILCHPVFPGDGLPATCHLTPFVI